MKMNISRSIFCWMVCLTNEQWVPPYFDIFPSSTFWTPTCHCFAFDFHFLSNFFLSTFNKITLDQNMAKWRWTIMLLQYTRWGEHVCFENHINIFVLYITCHVKLTSSFLPEYYLTILLFSWTHAWLPICVFSLL